MTNPHSNYAPPPLDEDVRNRILMEQMSQVRYIARHIHDRLPQHVPIEDLVHAGVLGLIDALTKYDEARQVQFKTYAKFRIRGAILDSLRELDCLENWKASTLAASMLRTAIGITTTIFASTCPAIRKRVLTSLR